MKKIPLILISVILFFLYHITQAQIGIGTINPNSSSLLELKSDSLGFLPPRMNNNELVNIISPAQGLVIFNTDTKCLEWYTGSNWISLCTNSTGTLNCSNSTVLGTCQALTALNANNYISVEVNVTQTGAWSIRTDVVNGCWFQGSGVFTTTGLQTINLFGYGTPYAFGQFNYTIIFGTSSCNFSIMFNEAPIGNGVLNCSSLNAHGIYNAGQTTNSSHYISIDINVITAGTFLITSNTNNGVSFSSGILTLTLGTHTIYLYASGTSILPGDFGYTVSYGASSCTTLITYLSSSPLANFVADNTIICETSEVQFTDLSSNNPTSWSWTFTGGTPSTSTIQNPLVTYNTAGNYTVSLIATNSSGSDSETKTSYIHVGATVNAGSDQTGLSTCGLTTVSLVGNTPTVGTGAWSIISGTGGSITTPTSPTSTFSGTAGTSYTLRWTISNSPCIASTDDVNIIFNKYPTASSASTTPTLCVNSPLTAITHVTTIATGIGTATGLPAGVYASWASNTITISGTPTVSGIFNYSIPLTGGCESVNATGTITVNASATNTVTAASSSPTPCLNALMTSITHATTNATGIGAATGLPSGVTAAWLSNVITISGTPTVPGTFNYSIPLTGGCGSVNATGTITVNPIATNTVTAASSSPTSCLNAVMTSITHTTANATGIGTATGLPAGVRAAWLSNVITISGTPTVSGTFTYSIPLTGGCGTVNATGTITVNSVNSVTPGSTCYYGQNTAITAITHTTMGATGIGTVSNLPNGVTATWTSNTITISGTPTVSGTFNYSIQLTGGCGTVNATGSIIVVVVPSNSVVTCTGKIWMDRNLGASQVATSSTDAASYGDLYQWGRLADGHQIRTSATTTTLSTGNVPLNGLFITTLTSPNDWRLPQNDNLWQGVTEVNNPCPSGFRIPTDIELDAERASWGSQDAAGAFTSALRLPMAGVRDNAMGALFNIGSFGAYWSSTVDGTSSHYLRFFSGFTSMYSSSRSSGLSVRCIADCTLPPTQPDAIIGSASVCNGTLNTYSVAAVSGAISYIWSYSGAGTPIGTGTSCTLSPTSSGTLSVTAKNGCGTSPASNLAITIKPNNTITFTSAAGTDAQAKCINTAITNITYSTTGATGATITGLPTGVTGSWTGNDVTISGTPSTTVGSPFTYTITLTGGCGTVNATGTITVTDLPPAPTGTSPQIFCAGSSPTVADLIATGTGIKWYAASSLGTPLISSTALANNTHYYASQTAGGCESSSILDITVTLTILPAATISYSGTPFCKSLSVAQAVTRTGSSGGTYSALPAGLSIDVSTGAITPSTSTAGAYTVTYSIAAANGCGIVTATASVTITAIPTATISYTGSPFCTSVSTAQAVTLSGTGAYTGGIYSSTAGLSINGSTGAITPSASTAGTYSVTYTIPASGGCSSVPVTTSVTTTTLPVATFSYTGTPYCSNAVNPSPVFSGGGVAGTFSSTAGLVFVSNTMGQVNLAASTAGSYTVTNTIAASGGCALVSSTSPITISTSPAATISYAGTPFCKSVLTAQAVSRTGTAGGTYSALPAGLSIDGSTGAITPGSSTAGAYTVTYTIAAANGCGIVTASASVTITAIPTATISYAGTPFCSSVINNNTITLSGTGAYTGGSYSSTAGLALSIITGEVRPTNSTAGTYTVTYTIPASGGCASVLPVTTSVTITALPVAIFNYTGTPYCSNVANPSPAFYGGGVAGTFSSTAGLVFVNAATGQVDLAASNAGSYTVTNNIAASGGCALVSSTSPITITKLPAANISYSGTPFCKSLSVAQVVTRTGSVGGTYSALPAGLSIDGSIGTITPSTSTAGAYTVTYSIAAANGCGIVTATTSVTITAVPTATISYSGSPFCTSVSTAQAVTLSGTGAYTGGTYSSSAGLTIDGSTGAITPSASTPGTYTVTYTIPASGGCSSVPVTTSVTITDVPAQPGIITGTVTVNSGTSNNYSIAAVSGAISYTWWYSGNGVPSGTGISCTLIPASSGILSVTANNACGSSSAQTLAIYVVPTNPTGLGSLTGRTCFDIARSNNDINGCGLLTKRIPYQADFTSSATNIQTYTFTPSGTVSNVRFAYVNTNGTVIIGLTGGNSGNNISTPQTATVSYNNALNSLAFGLTNSNPLTGDIYVVYNDGATNNGTDRQLKLTAQVKDCSCCGTSFTDVRDGKSYNTVLIGTQCWMAQNLNIGTKVNYMVEQSNNGIVEKYCHQDDESYCTIYGGVYEWAETVGYLNGASNTNSWNPVPTQNVQGICPSGWHVPTNNEFDILTGFLDPGAGGKMKETGYAYWYSPNSGATNSSGFTGLGTNWRYDGGAPYQPMIYGNYWTSTEYEYNAYLSKCRTLSYYNDILETWPTQSKKMGFGIRCVQD